jgi:membrane protein YdbS with pleckstrin-like domain
VTAFLDFLSTTSGGLMLIASTVGLAAVASKAPSWRESARVAQMEAAVSPLWLLMPILLGFFLVRVGTDAGLLLSAFGVKVPVLMVLQLVVSGWIVYRYRHWPFCVVPLAVLCCLWQWGLLMGAVLEGVNSLAL